MIANHFGVLRNAVLIASLYLGAQDSTGAEARYGFLPIDAAVFSQFPEVPRYRAFLPVSVDLSKHFPTPGSQDAESCTGWAVGYAARSYYAAAIEKRDVRDWDNVPSPSFIYNTIRDPKNCASGSHLVRALNLLRKGSLSLQEFNTECQIPTVAERERATDFKIKKWLAVNPKRIDDVKGQLARGNPVIFGMNVTEKFETFRGDGVYKDKPNSDFGHAMTVVGYDDERQAFRVINSWGTLWGDKGFAWIDYDTFKRGSNEAYIIEVEKKPDLPSASPPKPNAKPDNELPSEVAILNPEPEISVPKINETPVADIPPPIERPVDDSDCSFVYSEKSGVQERLTGFVGTDKELEKLRQQWTGYAEDFNVQVRPWPQCEVLLTLASAIGEKGSPRLSTKGTKERFIEGEEMVFELVTPPTPSFVYVTYVQADGSVLTLMQPGSELAPSKSGETVIFGDGKSGSPRFKAAPPFGTEMVLAVASASPLFDGPLPKLQTEREFLSALRRAVIYKSDQSKAERRVSAAFLGIQTERAR
jgi:hypothetical protein